MSEDQLPSRELLGLLDREVRGRLDYQLTEVDGLDTKATTVLAASGVFLGLVVTGTKASVHPALVTTLTLDAALLVLTVCLFIGAYVIWPREVRVVPNPTELVTNYTGKSLEKTLADLIGTRKDAYVLNGPLLRKKSFWLKGQMLGLAFAGALIAVSLLTTQLS